ncbi:MAG: 2,3-bisphosphoglycerate-independent phosphoglycerate mutase [Candidatus Thermoplasmatota archaeon]|jgi:2,3-bisphosphoglycerate-independent phosphoglycerate mutase|nr:2,3-bisphosphoglycerate-independent phosphoglycerate mutase [Candidatus Thermoplasmatota archaeon]
MMKKLLLFVLDGLGDRPNSLLNGETPLQAAYRPNLNALVRAGLGGMMYPVRKGLVCGSDTSHLSLLGYDPDKVYTGRGPFEAMGLGIVAEPGDIAFRANFATRSGDGVIVDRRAGRDIPESGSLAKKISFSMNGAEFIVKEGVEHRAALVIRGKGLSPEISDSDPHEQGKAPRKVQPLDESARHTADLVNEYLDRVRTILDSSPENADRESRGKPAANELLLRGAGITPRLQPFGEKYGLKGACLAGIPLITGIGNLAGLDLLKHAGATGRVDTDYNGIVKAAVRALSSHDFVIVNIKAPDIAGHDGDPLLKKDVIEKIDAALGQLVDLGDSVVTCVTGDHSTPCSSMEHSGDPVPILFSTGGMRRNNVRQFDEVNCCATGFNLLSGDVMTMLLQLSDRLEKYGA